MYSEKQLLEMLSSGQASLRLDACKDIRVSQESSPEIIAALEKAILDLDPDVAEQAKLALVAALHHEIEEKESPFLEHPGDAPKATSRGSGFDVFSFIFFRPAYLGQWLFYPWGALGHGYVVPTETDYVRLRHQFMNIIIIFSVLLFAIFATVVPGKHSPAILPFRWVCLIEPIYILAYIVAIRVIVRNLDKSPDVPMVSKDNANPGDFYSQVAPLQQRKYNPVVLWFLEIVCLVIILAGLILLVVPETRDFAAIVINLFGLFSVTLALMIIVQRREQRARK